MATAKGVEKLKTRSGRNVYAHEQRILARDVWAVKARLKRIKSDKARRKNLTEPKTVGCKVCWIRKRVKFINWYMKEYTDGSNKGKNLKSG